MNIIGRFKTITFLLSAFIIFLCVNSVFSSLISISINDAESHIMGEWFPPIERLNNLSSQPNVNTENNYSTEMEEEVVPDNTSRNAGDEYTQVIELLLQEMTSRNAAMTQTCDKLTQVVDTRLWQLANKRNQTNIAPAVNSASSANGKTDYVTHEEADAVFEELIIHLEYVKQSLNEFRADICDYFYKKLLEVSNFQMRMIGSGGVMTVDGCYKLKIPNVSQLRSLHRDGRNKEPLLFDNCCYESPKFQALSGHEFTLRLFMNGVPNTDSFGKHLSLFVRMWRSELDEILEYPFDGQVMFILFDQATINDKRKTPKHHVRHFKTTSNESFKKPLGDFNRDNGVMKYIPLEDLEKQNFVDDGVSPRYVKDNTLFLEVRVTKK